MRKRIQPNEISRYSTLVALVVSMACALGVAGGGSQPGFYMHSPSAEKLLGGTGLLSKSGGRVANSSNLTGTACASVTCSGPVPANATPVGYVPNASAAGPTSCSANCSTPLSGPPMDGPRTSGKPGATLTDASRSSGAHPAGWGGSGEYFLKSVYQGSTVNSMQVVYTSIFIPGSGTASGDKYFLLLNDMDSSGWWDQIGLSSEYGCGSCLNPYPTWTIAYEQGYAPSGGVCGGAWNDQGLAATPTGMQGLSTNSWYTFLMYVSGVNLVWEVYSGAGNMNGTAVWTAQSADTATFFALSSSSFACNGNGGASTVPANEVFEEVYNVGSGYSQPVPRWDFPFLQTTVAVYSGGGWSYTGLPDSDFQPGVGCTGSSCSPPPYSSGLGYVVDYSEQANEMIVANEGTTLDFPYQAYNIGTYSSYTATGYAPAIGKSGTYDSPYYSNFCGTNTCTTNSFSCSVPSGFVSVGYTSYATIPMPTGTPTYTPYSGGSTGTVYSGCTLTMYNALLNWVQVTTFIFETTVN
jgi:hypothetical protein